MEQTLPEKFIQRLHQIVPSECLNQVMTSFEKGKSRSFRINRCHPDYAEFKQNLSELELSLEPVSWYDDAYMIESVEDFEKLYEVVQSGLIYRQNLSSMLAGWLLDANPGETILDMCAAPGSKTTQIAAMMQNQGRIVALEAVRNRFYKLKAVAELMQATIIEPKCLDARRYRTTDITFDRILVDAPCSSEGRFSLHLKKTYAYWSVRKIREMRKKQRGLLMHAARFLRPGGRLLYSTCTFAPEENEAVVDWFLRKNDLGIKIEPIQLPSGIPVYPVVKSWNDKTFNSQVDHCIRICPDQIYDGFFIAVFKRQG